MVLVKEDNIPPGRWLLGRVTDTHPGNDGHVRVVSLKTKTGHLKRPVTKLSRLPIDPEEVTLAETMSQSDAEPPKRARRQPKKNTVNNYFCSLLMLIAVCMPLSSAGQEGVNIRELSPTRLVYLDKVADMQIIQDEWKMVVYYNMTTYWQGFSSIEKYASHLISLCSQEASFTTIATQVQHEVNEMQHFNRILMSEHGSTSKRRTRGLVDGVGYIANSLFGVLDERFAQQYEKDIQQLQANENHLNNLYKKQTSILEGEHNILQRNEKVMNEQFSSIHKYLAEQKERVHIDNRNMMHITATALAANMIMSNLRRVQEMVLDLVTDVKDGRVDTHLLKPDQFEEQLNIIAGQLPKDLSLPCINTRHCVREMYKLARAHVHLTSAFLIFEVKLPLINNEQYELNKIIPIPQITKGKIQKTVSTSDYMAINIKRDMIIPLSYQETTSCIHIKEHQLICNMNQPIYDTKADDSVCEAQIINNKNISNCKTVASSCTDRWTRLHKRGAWLFACCEACTTRTFCPAGMTSATLRGTGVITLGTGCMLKGANVILHSRNKFHSEITINEDYIYAEESAINYVLEDTAYTFTPEDHKEAFETLKSKIQTVKMQQDTLVELTSSHDTHHYASYSFMAICGIFVLLWSIRHIRRRLQDKAATQNNITEDMCQEASELAAGAAPAENSKPNITSEDAHVPRRLDKSTSP